MALKPLRLAAAALYFFGIFAQPLCAQVEENGGGSAAQPVEVNVVSLNTMASPLDAVELDPAGLEYGQIPNLPAQTSEVLPQIAAPKRAQAQAASKAASAGSASAAETLPRAAAKESVRRALLSRPSSAKASKNGRQAGAIQRLAALGKIARRLVSKPASPESDRNRADFTVSPEPTQAIAVGAPAAQDALSGAPASGLLPADASSGGGAAKAVPAESPSAPEGAAPKAWHYLTGIFMSQMAANALQVALPLVLLKLTSALSAVGFATALAGGMDALGTLVGGRLARHIHPKTLLAAAAAGRAATLALIPLFWTGGLGLAPILGVYLADSLIRGVADTARNTAPMALVGKNKPALDKLNARYQTAFELGGLSGPFLMGALLSLTGLAAANWMIPAAFAAASGLFFLMPRGRADRILEPGQEIEHGTFLNSLRLIGKNPGLRLAMLATLLVTVYPLKSVLPALFAKNILGAPNDTAWLVGAFGLGGVLGSLLYGRLYKKIPAPAWLKWGAGGVLAFAAAMAPHAFLPMALGCLVFAMTNVMSRISVASTLQSNIPYGAEGSVMGLTRFSGNLMSAALKFGVGLAFAFASPVHAFMAVGLGLGLVAASQLWLSRRLAAVALAGVVAAARPAAAPKNFSAHGLPGRLIVVEGLDGSGKSTQLEMLRESLEAQGAKVVTTRWNSSELVSEVVKKAKRERTLTPASFAALNAADLSDRLENVILPALREGSIVLSDRYFYTALARDSVRGNDPLWLRRLYDSVLRPDLTFYFRLPVETAIGRVLARTEDRLKLSEDFAEDGPRATVLGQNYYAVGRDMSFAQDDAENFRIFQSRVADSYDRQAEEFGFEILDARQDRESLRRQVSERAGKVLGPLEAYKRKDAPAQGANLFDKDPAGDAPNIQENYKHAKRGVHFYFRNMLLPMQERFAQLMDLSAMPQAFLHGSPHVDNYAKSARGAAMVDFDRSRLGPYAWDLARLMVSVSLRQKKPAKGLLSGHVLRQMKKGYLHGLRHPDRPFSEARALKDKEPKKDESSTDAYLAAEKGWTQEMRADPLPPSDPKIQTLLRGYLENRGEESLLDDYVVEEAGRGQGSMGFRSIYLAVLAPKNPKSGLDRIFLNFKQVRADPDTRWFTNPYPSQGRRMIEAGNLLAPGWEERPGFAALDGVEYYVRQIQPQNAKMKKMLDKEQQEDFVYAVGTQLGRAHALSVKGSPEGIEAHLESSWDALTDAALIIRDEIAAAHARYLKKLAAMEKAGGHGS